MFEGEGPEGKNQIFYESASEVPKVLKIFDAGVAIE